MFYQFLILSFLAASSVVGSGACAAAGLPIQSARLEQGERILLDGSLSHPAWQRAPVHSEFFEQQPDLGATPKFETRVQVLVGEQALYVGITALDSNPQNIRAPLVRHDQVRYTQDFVGVYIDSVGKGKHAQFFRVSAGGSTGDGQHTADDDNEDFSPDYDFEAASQITTQGYTSVFRIPFASLRFTGDGALASAQPWRMQVVRRVPREQSYLLMSVPLKRSASSFIEAMQTLQGVQSPADTSFLQLRPNLTLRKSSERTAGVPDINDNNINLGLDAKWRPNPQLVVDLTLKPDFSQVELDSPQLSRNNQFALYLQEKRPFFLESSDLLRSPTDALYTRSVTLPRWGLRASLRTDAGAGTVFAAHDMGGGQVLLPGPYSSNSAAQPESDVLISRVRWDSKALTLGAIASLRSYADGRGSNTVIGPDLTWQATDELRLRAQLLGSQTSAGVNDQGQLVSQDAKVGSQFNANAYWKSEPYEAGATVEDLTKNYRNDNGFVSQNGYRNIYLDAHRVWRNAGPFTQIWANLDTQALMDKDTGNLIYSKLVPRVYFGYNNNSNVNISYRGFERVRASVQSDILHERYWQFNHSRNYGPYASNIGFNIDWGQLADFSARAVRQGRRLSIDASLRPVPRLELTPSLSTAEFDAPAGSAVTGSTYRESAAQLLGVWHLAPQQVLRLIVQRSSVDRRAEPNVSSYSDRGQTDSLTYIWRKTLGTSYNLGIIRANSGITPNNTRTNELFAKVQVDVDEWRAR